MKHRSLILGILLTALAGMAYGGVFQQGEHGGVDASYPDRGEGWFFDGVTGVSRAHKDPFYASIPRGQCYHCHEYLNVLEPLYWPMTFTPYDTQEQRVDFCGNCHTDSDPDANGTDGDTPADYSFKGPSKFKVSQHYKRKLRWPGGQYGSDYPERTDERAGVCTNCHNPHAHAYSSSYASIPSGWDAADVPFPKQLAELTDVNNTPDPMPDWGVVYDPVTGTNRVTGWPNVNGRDPDDAEDICFTCHDGDPVQNVDVSGYNTYLKSGGVGASSASSIKAAIEQPYHHPVKDSRQVALQTNPDVHFAGSVAKVLYKVECTTCHNPHLASGHWNDFYDDPTATPLVLPGVSDNWPDPAPAGYEPGEQWGDEPEEKMNGLLKRMFEQKGVGGCGTWQFNVDRGLMGQVPPCDQPAIYRAPFGGDGSGEVTIQMSEDECIAAGKTHPCYKQVSTNGNFQPDGDQLPDIPTFCLDCHQNQVADHRPIYWGANFPTPESRSGQPQGHEPHGFDRANAPVFACYDCDANQPGVQPNTSAGCWGIRGSGSLVGETRGLGFQTFTRAPYDIEDRLSGANFVLACTDCHEPHGSSKRSLFRHTVNGNPINSMTHNEICNSCHYYYGGEMKYNNCGGGGMKSCGSAGCHNGWDCGSDNPGNYCYSLHRIRKNHMANEYYVYKPKSPDHPYTCADNGPGVIGVWHFDDNNATSGVVRGNYEDSTVNQNDLARGHKGAGVYDGPFNGGSTQPWSGSLCTTTACANLFSTSGPFGYTGDKSMNLNGRDGFAFSRVARCHNMRSPNPEILSEDGLDPASEASNFTMEAWVYFDPTEKKGAYSISGRSSFDYHPGGRLMLAKWPCGGIDSCIPDKYYPMYEMSVYDKTVAGLNGAEVTTDTEGNNDYRGGYAWKDMPEKQWTLLTVTFDSSLTDRPIRIYMNGVDVTSNETRDADAAPNAVKQYRQSQPPTGWAQNSENHPFLLPDGSADAKYCPTCNSWFKKYMSYMQGWAFGIQSNLGTGDANNLCGGNLGPGCGWPDPMEGMLDDVRIANITMTPEEVCARFTNGVAGTPAPTTIEPGVPTSQCEGWLDTEPAATPEPIVDASSWLDEKIYLTDPNILQTCVTHPDDGSASARGVVAMWQFDASNPYLDATGNGGDVAILRNKDGLAWRDIVPNSANSGAANIPGLWGTSLPGFGSAWQSNGDGFMRTRPVTCQSMRYPDPNHDSATDLSSNPGVDPNAATQMSIDAWINPSFSGYSGVYYTGPDAAATTAVPHTWPYDPLNVLTDRPVSMQIMSKFGEQGHRVSSYVMGLESTCAGNALAGDYRLAARISFWDNDQVSRWRGAYSNVSVPLDSWSHVAMTFDANDATTPIRVYLNGKDVTADLSGSNDPDPLANDACDQPPSGWPMSTTRSDYDCVASTTYTVNGTPVAAGVCESWWMDESYYRRTPTIGAWNGQRPGSKAILPNKNFSVQRFPDPWFGKIDDLRLHNKSMTPTELCSRYKRGLTGVPASMTYETTHPAASCF